MFVGAARVDFMVPGSTSLKEKRKVVRSMVAAVGAKFNVAVAEVEYQDLWQRAAVGVSCVANSSFHAKKVLREVERFIRGRYEIEVVDYYIEVMTPDA